MSVVWEVAWTVGSDPSLPSTTRWIAVHCTYPPWQVIQMETYDTKCDVYSFAVLLWEILCLKQAFKGLTPTEFVERVVVKRERMAVPKTLPSLVRLLLPEAWDDQPMRRPDMKRVAILIRGDLNDLTHDDQVLNRTNHMDDRSVESLRGGE